MLKQAYAQSKYVERLTGQRVTPLLVFNRAYLDRPGRRREGVVVLPSRMLGRHLDKRATKLTPQRAADIHARLAAALETGPR